MHTERMDPNNLPQLQGPQGFQTGPNGPGGRGEFFQHHPHGFGPFRDGMYGFYGHHHEGWGGPHVFALLLFLLLLIAIVVLLWRSFRARPAAGTTGHAADGALDLVRLRYAKGEIGRDEFLRLNEDLGGHGAASPPAA
jgi:uncharacterized membrane protein